MSINQTFNLAAAVQAAESGESSLWEEIARHLLAKRKTQNRIKPAGLADARNDRHAFYEIKFADGITILRSAYNGRKKGETGDIRAMAGARFMRALALCGGRFLTDKAAYNHIPPVASIRELDDFTDINAVRNTAFFQRETEPGWGRCLLDPFVHQVSIGEDLQFADGGHNPNCPACAAIRKRDEEHAQREIA